MKKEGIDISLLINNSESPNSNFTYFTQINSINSALLVKDNPVLYTSPLELSIAENYSYIKNIKKLDKNFFSNIRNLKPKVIGIDKNLISLNQFKNLKLKLKNVIFKDISKELFNLRLIKTENEINLIKSSCKFADSLISKSIEFIRNSKTEIEVKKLIEKEILDMDLQQSFPVIIASNKNSKNPHHMSNNTKLKGFTIIDLGVKYKNYCSDITRTVYVGNPKKDELNIYNKVLNVQEDSIRNNLLPSELNEYTINKLGKYFTHSLGHGIGLDVHELPNISSSSKDKFQDNMTFTIEPGYYNKFGIRIEDDFLYKNNRKTQLTNSSKELIIL